MPSPQAIAGSQCARAFLNLPELSAAVVLRRTQAWGDNAANQRLELAVVLKFCQASRGAVGVTGNIADTDRRLAPLRPNGYQGNPGLLFVPGHQQRSISQPGKDDGDDLLDARGLNGAN